PPPRLERDLDTIVMKCLSKDPERRYATAAELADDLDRWLRGEPIRARRPSLGYRARKFASRHRVLLGAVAVAIAATLRGLAQIFVEGGVARRVGIEALALSSRVTLALTDAFDKRRSAAMGDANRVLDAAIAECRDFLARHDVARVEQLLGRCLRARGRRE